MDLENDTPGRGVYSKTVQKFKTPASGSHSSADFVVGIAVACKGPVRPGQVPLSIGSNQISAGSLGLQSRSRGKLYDGTSILRPERTH